MLLNLSFKESIIFLSLLVIEYFLLYLYFGKNKTHSKFVLLFIVFFTIKYINKNFLFINNIYLILLISFFYYKNNNNVNKEGFISKLKNLKDKNKYDNDYSSLNNTLSKKKKENFKSTKRIGMHEYYNSFKNYKFTKKNKGVLDGINKFPLYIEKFKEIFN